MNKELKNKFDVQPINKLGLPEGDLMQIAVPNSTSEKQFMLLVQAFLKASRLPYPM